MPNVNLYVSAELKSAMGEYELPWSRIAAEAFETAINLERTKEVSIEQGSIERLRNERASATERREAEGFARGKLWAQEAKYVELERVAKIDTDDMMEHDESYRKVLSMALLDNDPIGWDDVREAMERLFGRGDPSYAEVCGFIDGAAEFFDQV